MMKSAEYDYYVERLKGWLLEFHGQVRDVREEELNSRVNDYILQEELYREKVRFVLHLLEKEGCIPKRGLDIGSSAGGLSVALAQAGLQMDGVEPSKVGVEVSRLRAERLRVLNAHFQEGIGEELPFPDGAFDLVVSIAVLEHVMDIDKVVAETYRVLRPGGFAYFEVPNNIFPFEGHYKMAWLPMMPKVLAKRYVALRGGRPEFLDSLHYMSRPIIFKQFKSAGFKQLTDNYGDYLYGKASRASWANKATRFPQNKLIAEVVPLLFGDNISGMFMNRAVMLLCRKA